MLALIAFAVIVANNLRASRLGRAWMAIREDELAAAHVGINTTTTKLSAFAIGASFSGLAGVAYASKLQLVSPDQFRIQRQRGGPLDARAGRNGQHPRRDRREPGHLVARSLHFAASRPTSCTQLLHTDIDLTNSRFLIYGIILVLTMLFRPEGLMPSRQRRAEFKPAPTTPSSAQSRRSIPRPRADGTARRWSTSPSASAVSSPSSDLTFTIEPGSIVAMIGPNGAGKSTVFNLITGIYKPTEGTITFDGKAINGMATSDIAALRHRAHVSEHSAVRVHVGARQRHDRRTCAHEGDSVRLAAAHAAPAQRGTARARAKRSKSCASSISKNLPETTPTIWRTAFSAGSKSVARWRATRSFCCSTNPRPG